MNQVRLEFSERMSGHFVAKKFSLNPKKLLSRQDFTKNLKEDLHHPLQFNLKISVSDLDGFLLDPSQSLTAEGDLTDFRFRGKASVSEGYFQLFSRPEVSADFRAAQEMHYTLFFADEEGKKWTFFGFKELLKEESFKMWAQTTTLYYYIWEGHSTYHTYGEKEVHGLGCLKISAQDFLKQLTSFKTSDSSFIKEKESIARFIKNFSAHLWSSYAPFIFTTTSKRWNEHYYPVNTTQGVHSGTATLHPLDTRDGLTVSLQRFCVRPQKDIILLLHGLTTSTDMFIMPEHQNLVNTLHAQGFCDVWSLDWRGSGRFTYNLQPHKYTIDDVAQFDIPRAVHYLKETCGPDVRIHVIAHCVGALSLMASHAAGYTDNIASIICNSVSLTPQVPLPAMAKMMVGPHIFEQIFKYPFISPRIPYYPGKAFGKWIYWMERTLRRECAEPACHMISFMWGWGFPAAFNHRNIHPTTHRRLADLFGGTSFHYHKHIRKMLLKKASVSWRNDREINYLQEAKRRNLPPLLLISGAENRIFPGSNKKTFEHLKQSANAANVQYKEFPLYGHQDIFMGQFAHKEVFPTLIKFLSDNATLQTEQKPHLTLAV